MSEENAYESAEVPPEASAASPQQNERGQDAANRPAQGLPPSGRKAAGLLGSWLRRGEPQQQSSSHLTVKTGSSTPVAEPGSPTWSETSETSDFASVGASPAAKAASAAAVFNNPQVLGQPHARLAGRLGGWLTGVTSAAGVVLGGAVRGGTKALQRLTAQEQLQDLHAASQHLEATAAGLQGETRMQTLQKWCTLLRELHPSHLPLLQPYTLNALHPNSPHRASCDNDWQQLQFASEPPDPNASYSAASMHHGPHQKAGTGSSSSIGASQQGHMAKGSELEFWANQVLYLDQESSDPKKELLTFRELFLHSYALENIIVGYLDVPASQPQDRSVLVDLFGLCLAGDSDLHTRLVDTLMDLSAVEAECRGVGTAASLGPEQPMLANVVAETICGLKIQAECEVLDRKMASLQADIGEQAAEVHRNHKFNSGATEPTGESSPAKLASGLVGTAEVMQLGSRFQQLSVQRAAQIANRPQPQYDKYMGVAHAHAKVLDAAVADLEAQADTMHKQKADGEAFRERKLDEMEGAMHVIDSEIGVLEEQQADLLRQLAIVQQQIGAAKAKRADMEEGRHVFQEGNAFTLEALQHKVDGISLQHQHHLAENAALAECQALIQEAAKGWQATAKAAEQVSQSALQRAGQEYMHAATRHLYYQRALLQLLLRQLTFCAGELKALAEKEGSLERMGMEAIVSDMRAGKQRLQAKYLEAHASAQQHFSDVAAVRIAVEAACKPLPRPQPPGSSQADSTHDITSQQAPEAKKAAMPPSADASHPLAGTQDLAKPAQASSVTDVGLADTSQLASGIQVTGLSEELLDLFDSIQQLQQEVAALPQPQHVSPAAPGTQSGQGSEQPKDQLQGDPVTEQAATDAQQPKVSQEALASAKAQVASVSAAVQLDMQMSAVQGAVGEASALASSSANDMLVCNKQLSSMYPSQSEEESRQSDWNTTAAASQKEQPSSGDACE